MNLIRRIGIVCAVIACASLVMAEDSPIYKSASSQQKKAPQLSEGVLSSATADKAAAAKGMPLKPGAARAAGSEQVQSEPAPRVGLERAPNGSGFRAVQARGEAAVSGIDAAAARGAALGGAQLGAMPPQPCDEDVLYGQRCSTYDDGSFGGTYSDLEYGTVFEGIWDVRGDIDGLSWYGVFMDTDMGFPCGDELREFEIGFYEDAGGTPGAQIAFYTVQVIGEPSNMEAGFGAYVEGYTVEIDPPVTLRNGWVSIVGAGEPDACPFSWISAPDGTADNYYCRESEGEMSCTDPNDFWSWDVNICVLGTFYPGACCDDFAHDCSDEVAYVDCLPPLRFEADTYCADLNPQCGDISGACCEGDGCSVTTPSECAALGGIYKGDYVPCDPNPCVGACCLPDFSCDVMLEDECDAEGGSYIGDATSCDPNPCPPPNDDCSNAEPVIEGAWRFDTLNATLDGPQECPVGQNAWFCYTASATGTVTVRVDQDDGIYWGPSCAAYAGCSCDPAPPLVTCDPYGMGQLEFDVQAGEQYLIEVGEAFYGEPLLATVHGGPGTLSITLTAWAFGACCTEETPFCEEVFEPMCGGAFAGDGTTCDPTDCNESGYPDACDIAMGISQDCNGNGIPDECDIADGVSDDYDWDGVPDECDPDCNGNGIPDRCDTDCQTGDCINHPLGCGGSDDCQPDGIPDECQLGAAGGDETVVWDNGEPDIGGDYFYTLVSQVGGDADGAFIVDDFMLSEGVAINTFHARFEDEVSFVWSGRVKIEIYPDNGIGAPDDSNGPIEQLWIPDDGGAVTRTFLGAGIYADMYRYDVTGLNIEMEPGVWWIGMASETNGFFGMAAWASSAAYDDVVMGEAHLHWPSFGINGFIPASNFWMFPNDVSFSIGTTISGADCNENMIPDECDIADCDGSPWCLDCNENGVPDGCEPDCNDNGVADECDIRDCDGSPWCLDCNENGVPDGCEPDCNENGIADECDIRDCDGSPWCLDCNENGVPDECDIADGTSDDYDLDGVPDECDPDCNENGVPDACDVNCATGNCSAITECGASLDCQPDGVPDECQLYGEFEYLTDDGTSEDSVGLSSGGYIAWLTQFTVTEDFDSVTAISLAWGNMMDGVPTTVYVWSDPNGDGDPSDAKVLASAETVSAYSGTDTLVVVDVPDVRIGPPGTTFFVGAILEHDSMSRPCAIDTDNSMFRSWIAGDNDNPLDPDQLGLAPIEPMLIDNVYQGNWLVRAVGFFNNDCNDNGRPDDCDIADDPSLDCNGNLVIDACEWVDCDENGVLDACDILECDGSPWCGDCNGNGVPDVCDIANGAVDCQPNGIPDECEEDCNGNGVVDDCDIRDCDGSIWCDDCNENGVPDVCDAGQAGGAVYQYDDGSAEDSLGIGEDVEICWVQRFTAEPGSETITTVSTCFGNTGGFPGGSGVNPGDLFRVFVWDDPEDSGNPMDMVLVASATAFADEGSIDTDVLQEVAIEPVTVSGSFFIGAAVASTQWPSPVDADGELAHESWITFGWIDEGGFDPTMIESMDNTDDIGYSCNWLLRAASLVSAAPDDCNGNGIPDECEQCGDLDMDGDVDYNDYVLFLDAFGGVTDGTPMYDWCCDYDGTGAVGMLDFVAWLECYRDFVGDPYAGVPENPNKRAIHRSGASSKVRKSGFVPAP